LFLEHPNLRIEAHEEDLKTYLYQELEQDGVYDRADQAFVNRLVRELTKGADGMYVFLASFPIYSACAPFWRLGISNI
jgi:hypothetical protein